MCLPRSSGSDRLTWFLCRLNVPLLSLGVQVKNLCVGAFFFLSAAFFAHSPSFAGAAAAAASVVLLRCRFLTPPPDGACLSISKQCFPRDCHASLSRPC